VFAGGISAPYAALHRYPADSAARFASLSWNGSAFVVATVGIAYAVNDQLRVGATLQNFFSKLSWSLVMSGCPPTETCDDADRTYDMPVDIDQTDYVSPSGSIGVQYDVSPYATLGLALQAPTKVAGSGSLTAKLPTNLAFQNGRITGDEVAVSYTLPPSIRAGVEAHPLPRLKIEAALDVELWSMHDKIAIDTNEIAIESVVGGPYAFGDMAIARDYKTSFSPSLGVEYRMPLLVIGGGYAYESAAAPASTVSPLTVDGSKHLFAIGGGYEDDGWQIGAAIAYVTTADVDVAPGDAKVTRLAPLRSAPIDARVNAGSYSTSFVVAGLRFARRW
jgi:long-subunit fatty acid transport protein